MLAFDSQHCRNRGWLAVLSLNSGTWRWRKRSVSSSSALAAWWVQGQPRLHETLPQITTTIIVCYIEKQSRRQEITSDKGGNSEQNERANEMVIGEKGSPDGCSHCWGGNERGISEEQEEEEVSKTKLGGWQYRWQTLLVGTSSRGFEYALCKNTVGTSIQPHRMDGCKDDLAVIWYTSLAKITGPVHYLGWSTGYATYGAWYWQVIYTFSASMIVK